MPREPGTLSPQAPQLRLRVRPLTWSPACWPCPPVPSWLAQLPPQAPLVQATPVSKRLASH